MNDDLDEFGLAISPTLDKDDETEKIIYDIDIVGDKRFWDVKTTTTKKYFRQSAKSVGFDQLYGYAQFAKKDNFIFQNTDYANLEMRTLRTMTDWSARKIEYNEKDVESFNATFEAWGKARKKQLVDNGRFSIKDKLK